VTAGQRFARLVTTVVVRVPGAWRLFRGPLTRGFDRLAPSWETRVGSEGLRAILAAVAEVSSPPARALDVGTGTGRVARALAERWPAAEVAGADASRGMLAEARRLGGGVRYDVADAAALPYADGAFELVTLNNMIPFFDELARITAPGGHLAIGFGMGDRTPIYVPLERVRAELERRGFMHVASFSEGGGTALLARKTGLF
jgi:SAM-dependent methyltransferase